MTELTTQDDAEFNRRLAQMSGQYIGGSDNFIPKLSVNRAAEDPKTKQDLPIGAFTLNTKAHGRVFAKRKESIQFRLYAKRYGYVKFDNDYDNGPGQKKGATTARSVQLSDFRKGSEYISDDGTLKCGKASLPEGTKNPTVKTKIFFYGTVSFKGTTVEGTEVELVNEPCVLVQGGKNFLTIDGIFKDFGKDGRRFFDYYMTLTPVYVPVADSGVYNVEMSFTDLTKRLDFGDEGMKTLESFFNYIEGNNKAIELKFNQAIANRAADADTTGDSVVAGGDDLGDDLIDEEEHED
jgi:hypothetical protein